MKVNCIPIDQYVKLPSPNRTSQNELDRGAIERFSEVLDQYRRAISSFPTNNRNPRPTPTDGLNVYHENYETIPLPNDRERFLRWYESIVEQTRPNAR